MTAYRFVRIWVKVAYLTLVERLHGARSEYVFEGRVRSMTELSWLAAKALTAQVRRGR